MAKNKVRNAAKTAIRKQTQIDKTKQLVFLWVAGASVIVSAAAVIVVMMVQKGVHTQRAISELHNTVKTLRQNNENIPELENQVRALGSNAALLHLRNSDSDNALRVVLDALPAESNPSALGASLQDKLFSKVTVESIRVVPAGSEEEVASEDEESADAQEDKSNSPGSIPFQFVVHGTPQDLKTLLERLQKSVRTIEVTNITVESEGGSKQKLTVDGKAYYLPAYELKLHEKEIAA